jgi:hypothetical protein
VDDRQKTLVQQGGSLQFPIVASAQRLLLKRLEGRLTHANLIPAESDAEESLLKQRWMNCEALALSVTFGEGYSTADIRQLALGLNCPFIPDVDVFHWRVPARRTSTRRIHGAGLFGKSNRCRATFTLTAIRGCRSNWLRFVRNQEKLSNAASSGQCK